MKRYPIPAKRVRVETRASNSRFIATLDRASTVTEAKAILQAIRDEMPDATHHVYGYRVGHGSSVTEGVSDDGEPSGTSGPPVLAALRGSGLGDAIIVVTRYFGGTKLGTGGLVAAYGAAAKEALASVEIEQKIERETISLAAPYALYEAVRRLAEECEGIFESENFGAEVEMRVSLPEERLEEFAGKLRNLSNGKLTFQEKEGAEPL
jgi:uncharacterized YigZ family protein